MTWNARRAGLVAIAALALCGVAWSLALPDTLAIAHTEIDRTVA